MLTWPAAPITHLAFVSLLRLYNQTQKLYISEYSNLLASPLTQRDYLIKSSLLTQKRDASLRQIALLHAHQVDTARKAYEAEKTKIEDEARQARKMVREKLTAAVDEKRRKLKEEKESGENAIGELIGTRIGAPRNGSNSVALSTCTDTFMDSISRTHATRKLRNKHGGTSRRHALAAAADIDSGDDSSVAGGAGSTSGTAKDRNKDGSVNLGNGGNSAATTSNNLGLLVNNKGMEGVAPILGLSGLPDMALLDESLKMFGDEAESSSSGRRGGKGGQKGRGKKRRAAEVLAASNAQNGVEATEDSTSAPLTAEEEREARKAAKQRQKDHLSFLAMAAASLPATLSGSGSGSGTGASSSTGGGGRSLRWEPGRSVLQLTGAKDYETESDLIRIRGGVGGGKRRRGVAAAAT